MHILDLRPPPVRLLDALDGDARGLGALLAPLGSLYAAGGRVRRALKPARFLPNPPPSVGVGNLRVGGTGKTPVVADLGERLTQRGLTVQVISRGYRGAGGGDEPGWLAQRLGRPPILDADRGRAFQKAADAGAQVVLMDDALQTPWRPTVLLALVLEADLDSPPRPLPAGPAREGAGALERADALLVRVETWPWQLSPPRRLLCSRRAREWTGGPAFPFRLAPVSLVGPGGDESAPRTLARRGPVVLVSGIARPTSFEASARQAGLAPVASVRLEDHARPGRAEGQRVQEILERLRAASVVTTEKNLERIERLGLTTPLFALRCRVEWEEDPCTRLLPALGI